MFTKLLLATLVAITLSACYGLTGQCMNGGYGPQCTADGSTYDADDASGGDSKVSESDANSSPETGEVDAGPKLEEVCKNFMFLKDTAWVCHANFEIKTTLGVTMNNLGVCLVYGWYNNEKGWQVRADSILFQTPNQLVWDSDKYGEPPSHGFGPKVCDKIK